MAHFKKKLRFFKAAARARRPPAEVRQPETIIPLLMIVDISHIWS
jgi:hypothetical protein